MSTDAAGFAHATDRSVAPPNGAFDAGLRPGPFPDRAASLLPGLLAATRTGLTPAGDDELPIRSQPLDDHLLIPGRTGWSINQPSPHWGPARRSSRRLHLELIGQLADLRGRVAAVATQRLQERQLAFLGPAGHGLAAFGAHRSRRRVLALSLARGFAVSCGVVRNWRVGGLALGTAGRPWFGG